MKNGFQPNLLLSTSKFAEESSFHPSKQRAHNYLNSGKIFCSTKIVLPSFTLINGDGYRIGNKIGKNNKTSIIKKLPFPILNRNYGT